MNILIGCEFSATVREAFTRKGHNAWSCDILSSDVPGKHIQGDVLEHLDKNWDMAIFHPPCTYLANSGVRWLYKSKGVADFHRWHRMQQGAFFFKKLLDAPIPKICIENPIMHKHAKKIIGVNHSQTIQPWQFGHGETKRTALWLKGLPPLSPTDIVEGREARIHRMPPSAQRSHLRSIFYRGIAEAMADQWG